MLNNSNSQAIETSTGSRREQGFSVVELIIAMVVFLIVTGAVYGVLLVGQRSRKTVNQQTQLTKNVRLALNLMGRDTYNAGFDYPLKNSVNLPDNRISTLLGIPNDANTTPDSIPPLIAGNNITLNTFNSTANTRTDQITVLFKDSAFNVSGTPTASRALNISGISQAGSINQVTVAATSGSTNAACSVNDIYIITGTNGSALGVATGLSGGNKILFAAGDALGFNQDGATSPIGNITGLISMQRVRIITYYVTADGILTRREYANVPPANPVVSAVDEPLVYGVEDFQIQYVLDDGTVSNNPSAGADGIPGNADDDQSKLSLVRQIKYTVNVKSVETNAAGQPFQVTMNSTFGTRNLGYDSN